MNIGEANAVNTVARYLLGKSRPAGPVTDEDAIEALELLTRKAHRVLSAGLRPEEIRPAFERARRKIQAGQPFNPGTGVMPGYVAGECGHRVAESEWRAGLRNCERCGEGGY